MMTVFSSNSILDVLFIFIITVSVAYIFGLTIVRMVDHRFEAIEQKLPSSSIFMENFKNPEKKKNPNEVAVFQQVDAKEYDDGTIQFTDVTAEVPQKQKNYQFDHDYYQQMNKYNSVEGFANQPPTSPLDWNPTDREEKIRQYCPHHHEHTKDRKSKECFYGVTNYADPRDMSPIDYNIFILNYPPNMTMQDYVNWLWCFKDKKDQLTYNHLRNLEKLELGKPLKYEEGVCPPPGYYHQPMNAEDYFEKLYNENTNEFQIAESLNSTTAAMMPYNFGDYSEFSQNRDSYGLSGTIRNPDIGLKTTAAEADQIRLPKDSQNLEIEKAFKPYHVKKIEI
jgi:hypothetical protein